MVNRNKDRAFAWAERVGRDAVRLGFPYNQRLEIQPSHGAIAPGTDAPWATCWPDFRDLNTESSCIDWFEEVARETYGENVHITMSLEPGRERLNVVINDEVEIYGHPGPTLIESCMKGILSMKKLQSEAPAPRLGDPRK